MKETAWESHGQSWITGFEETSSLYKVIEDLVSMISLTGWAKIDL